MRHVLLSRAVAGLLFLSLLLPTAVEAAEPQKIAIFDIELLNTSLEKTTDAENNRLTMMGDMLRDYYRANPGFEVVDTPELRAAGRQNNLQSCGGCDTRIAGEAGADLSMTGVVQKVSNLILSFTLYIRSTETGKLVEVAGTDIRGNTDESWQHGIKWLARNRLHVLPAK
ncbi:hypothetical protein HDIA_0922 [Hartmannibacter diazotrophicus]|uniref:DUF2380 domain-containing protein n=1 Tax=Hartmannibacter diazotrophicus TaxID=1482074 RepID=A0A2C9D2K9_9HYPH|nr:DUF3280 domain-containing protein [Hartmannibacter diazotrophicus]SON54463.1 hypothetical protein HDIA_0922 [Hartmannibacter diazotrophicus]